MLAFIVLCTGGCATPVGVNRLDEQAAHRKLNANVLSTGKPSAYSTQILERYALSQRYKSDPEAVLAELNSGLGKPDERDRLFALSELSFAYAENREINPTIWGPQHMRMPSCFRQTLLTHQGHTIHVCGLRSTFTIAASPWDLRRKTERKLTSASAN